MLARKPNKFNPEEAVLADSLFFRLRMTQRQRLFSPVGEGLAPPESLPLGEGAEERGG